MNKIYLASRYSRREELSGYAEQLRRIGFIVTSRWLDGKHELLDRENLSAQAEHSERVRFAQEDWEDLMAADICINFTEEPRGTNSRGGRHVEFGAALATGKRVIVVGHRENVFHCLPQLEFCSSWVECFRLFRRPTAREVLQETGCLPVTAFGELDVPV